MSRPTVGVLALQGGVREHLRMLESLDARTRAVRRPSDLAEVDALVLPGGESSVIDKLARAFDLRDPLRDCIARGMPMYGTCAGMILLADRVEGAIADQQTLGGIDMTVRRNAFGPQVESAEIDLEVPDLGDPPVRATFIRAPAAIEVGPAVRVLASLNDGRAVAVQHGSLLATAFHPEVSGEQRFHRRLLECV